MPSAGGTVTSDNNIYILACESEESDRLFLFQYSHAENVWKRVGVSSPTETLALATNGERFHHLLVGVDQVLYFLAIEWTLGNTYNLLRMARYNRHTDQWQECSHLELNKKCHQMEALPCGPNLYFFPMKGTEVYCYDPTRDSWCKRTPPRISTDIFTAVAVGTEIFCAGRDRDVTQMMVYNTVSDSWYELAGWPNPEVLSPHLYIFPRLFILENQLHVLLAAFDMFDKPSGCLVYVYDRSADAWRDLEAALPDEAGVGCCFECCVARIYLPYLKGAQNHIAEVSS
ncbi:kelch repeat and BTB domain-containing protein 12-like [Branchiostoma floridae x Branchiostoma japonicum]